MFRNMIAAALSLTVLSPVMAQAEMTEGRRLSELAFTSIDESKRGHIDQGQFWNFGQDVFVSMDSNEDKALSLAEFLSWGYGMEQLAEKAGRTDAYETALRVVFAFWDRNGDGKISQTEHRQSLMADFRRADLDNDAWLTKEEFTTGYTVMIALRAAINPVPVE